MGARSGGNAVLVRGSDRAAVGGFIPLGHMAILHTSIVTPEQVALQYARSYVAH